MEKANPIGSERFTRALNSILRLPENLKFPNSEEASDLLSTVGGGGRIRFETVTKTRLDWLGIHPSVWLEELKQSSTVCKLPMDDLYYENFGEIDGRLVLIDYGD